MAWQQQHRGEAAAAAYQHGIMARRKYQRQQWHSEKACMAKKNDIGRQHQRSKRSAAYRGSISGQLKTNNKRR